MGKFGKGTLPLQKKDDKGLHQLHEMSEALQKGPAHQILDPLKKGKK
jgi:hypothetical protein